MNFLSHFYFEKNTESSERITGTVLPDLIRNVNSQWKIHPQKTPYLFEDQQRLNNLLLGWQRHLDVDRIFHSSSFFMEKTNELKRLIIPILKDSPVRPSFLSHIGLELLLDHLLIVHRKIEIEIFYQHLAQTNQDVIHSFLEKCNIENASSFFPFFNRFIASKYLLSYQKIENISYALERICMRLWLSPFTNPMKEDLTKVLEFYKKNLEVDFMVIFEKIESRLI